MKRAEYPEPIKQLVLQLKRLPGVGPRSAERIALWIQQENKAFSRELAQAVARAGEEVKACPHCGFYATVEGCALCNDAERDASLLCVVEQPLDVIALDRTGAFRGRYHVLGGKLSPLRHVGPDELRIGSLVRRLRTEAYEEVILALSNDVEGEATANYLADLLRRGSLQITKLAQGLPAGGGLENADELTLFRALSGRRAWEF